MKKIFAPLVIGVLIAAVINQVLYFFAREISGEPFIIDVDGQGGEPGIAIFSLAPAVFTVFQGIVGGVVVAAIALATKRPRTNWLWFTLVGLAMSFIPTAFATAGVASTFLWLSSMHVVAGVVIIPLVFRALPEAKPDKNSEQDISDEDPTDTPADSV
jgi:hypothetical protein